MKKILLITMFLVSMLNFDTDWFDYFKADYFVSETGSDSNDGTAPWKAWATITKVNATTFTAGDRIGFKAGNKWNGTITVGQSGTSGNPITYKSYGIGAKPKIYGSEVITGWTLHSGNIYKKVLSDTINQLFINGERASLARYPKATYADGYADITTVNSTTQFISTQIASQAADYYKDATFVGRTNLYTIHRTPVTASTGQTITIATAPASGSGGLVVGRGFFFTNKLEFLTEAGEWMFDVTTMTVYAWMPNSDSPANYEVRGSVHNFGVNIASKNYITVKDLEILHSADYGIYVNASDYVTVDNNRIISPAHSGIQTYWNSDNSTITNNYIYEANNYGIRTYTNTNVVIANNEVTGIGKLENIGRLKTVNAPGSVWGTGINAQNANGSILNNTVTNSGYIGIHFAFGAFMVKNNFINGACQVLDDGGGIYTYNGTNYANPGTAGSEVTDNIVLNVHGNIAGSENTAYSAFGIYLDNETHDVLVEDNLVAGATFGIYLHDGGLNTINRNTMYDCAVGWLTSDQRANSTVKNNKFYLTNRQGRPILWGGGLQPQRVVYESNATSTIDSNMYVVPYTENNVFWNFASWELWKTNNSQDANSTYNGTDMTAGYTERVLYNETSVAKTWYLNNATNVTDAFAGTSVTTSFTLQPFTWKVVQGLNLDAIQDYSDAIAPVITAFTIPATSNTFQITITSLTSTGSATAYKITESETAPTIASAGWEANPTTYTFTTNGPKTLYAWARDAAGNVSTSVSDTINVNVPYPVTGHLAVWKMDETTGDNINDEIGTNDLTAYGTTIIDGKLGKARTYNGSSDYATGTTPARFDNGMTQDFSISLWFNPVAIGAYKVVFFGSYNTTNYVNLFFEGSSRLTSVINSAGTRYQYRCAAGEVPINAWYHVVITWDATGKVLKLYVNTVEKTTASTDYLSSSSNTMMLGAKSSGANWGNVKIDQMELIDHVLTTQEITDLYNSGSGIGYY